MNPALTVEALSSGYGSLRVFQDVSFTLVPGEVVGLLGANGAGKSTLLRTVVGLLPTFSGRVLLGTKDVSSWPAYRRVRAGLTLVPEGRQILGTLTVEDNLQLTRAASHSASLSFDSRMADVFRLFPRLLERRASSAASLSGGEQQMLAIARALLVSPSVLMLDEPTQGLAPVAIRALGETLGQLRGRFAMIVVEQNRAFVEDVADRIWEMRSGRLSTGAAATCR